MSDEPVVIKTYRTPFEADVARAKLEAAGIGAIVLHDDAGGMLPSLSLGSSVRLLVNEADAARTMEILESAGDEDVDFEEVEWDDEDWDEEDELEAD